MAKRRLLLGAILLAGCHSRSGDTQQGSSISPVAPDSPTPAMISNVMTQTYAQFLQKDGDARNTPFTLSSEKNDGQQIVVNGAPGYRLFLTTTIVMPNGYRPECVGNPGGYHCLILGNALKPSATRLTSVYKGSVDLTKTETGWLVTSVDINFTIPISQIADPAAPPPQMAAAPAEPPPCKRRVVTAAQLAEVERVAKISPQVNAVGLKNGGLTWNHVPVDLPTFKGYVGAVASINPPPYLVLRGIPNVAALGTDAQRILTDAGFCVDEK